MLGIRALELRSLVQIHTHTQHAPSASGLLQPRSGDMLWLFVMPSISFYPSGGFAVNVQDCFSVEFLSFRRVVSGCFNMDCFIFKTQQYRV